MNFYSNMNAYGFSNNTVASIRKFKCPRCGFEFSLVYARAIACQGCSEAAKNCPKVRCNKCDYEFYLDQTPDVLNKVQQNTLANHICKIVNDRNDGIGIASNNR
ncbi:MAG: hypothetical protein PHT00_02850 [Candidatus Methanomethylophilus sp.]|nr:hypothetical protein [Methanomethylophilus sp.]MDD4222658.1 hypothetical protein [Methanomethylophilus sp.]